MHDLTQFTAYIAHDDLEPVAHLLPFAAWQNVRHWLREGREYAAAQGWTVEELPSGFRAWRGGEVYTIQIEQSVAEEVA